MLHMNTCVRGAHMPLDTVFFVADAPSCFAGEFLFIGVWSGEPSAFAVADADASSAVGTNCAVCVDFFSGRLLLAARRRFGGVFDFFELSHRRQGTTRPPGRSLGWGS